MAIGAAVTLGLFIAEHVLRTYAWYGGIDAQKIVAETVQRRLSIEHQMAGHLAGVLKARRR
jgi:hypothetical protein